MSPTQAPSPRTLSATTLLMDTAFLRDSLPNGNLPVRLCDSSAQLWVAAVLAVGSMALFTLAFA